MTRDTLRTSKTEYIDQVLTGLRPRGDNRLLTAVDGAKPLKARKKPARRRSDRATLAPASA